MTYFAQWSAVNYPASSYTTPDGYNLSVQNTSSASNAFAATALTSGRFRFSMQYLGGAGSWYGVADSSVLNAPYAFTSGFAGYNPDNGQAYSNNATQTTFTTSGLPTTYWVDFAVDCSAGLIWIRVNGGDWNNNSTANPDTNTGGFVCSNITTYNPFWNVYNAYGSPETLLNSGQQSYAFTMPTTFANLPATLQITGVSSASGTAAIASWVDGAGTTGLAYSLDGGSFTTATGSTSGTSGTATTTVAGSGVHTLALQSQSNTNAVSVVPFVFNGIPWNGGGSTVLQTAGILGDSPSDNPGPQVTAFTEPVSAINFKLDFAAIPRFYTAYINFQSADGTDLPGGTTFDSSATDGEGNTSQIAVALNSYETVYVAGNSAEVTGTVTLTYDPEADNTNFTVSVSCNGTTYSGSGGAGSGNVQFAQVQASAFWYPGPYEKYSYAIGVETAPPPSYNVAIADTLLLADIGRVPYPIYNVATADTLALADHPDLIKNLTGTISDALDLTDTAETPLNADVSVADDLSLSDFTTIQSLFGGAVIDALDLTDSADYVFAETPIIDSFIDLYPDWFAWKAVRSPGSVMNAVAKGLAQNGAVLANHAKYALTDMFPTTTKSNLAEWQETLGITNPTGTLQQQQNQIAAVIGAQGGASIPYFQTFVANLLGITADEVFITCNYAFIIGFSKIGLDQINGRDAPYIWNIAVPSGSNTDLVLASVNKIKPAQSQITVSTYG